MHADQTHGINDLEFFIKNKKNKLMFMLIIYTSKYIDYKNSFF